MVFSSLGRLRRDTAGTAERWARISSALRGLEPLRCFFAIEASPAVSRVNKDSEGFSAMMPLRSKVKIGILVWRLLKTYPERINSSRTSSSPS